MEVHLKPEVQAKLDQMARDAGRPPVELIEDAMNDYSDELARTREMLDQRYDDLKSGRVQPLDGEAFLQSLRRREDELLNKSASQ
ncbi:MAG: hypothetical protein ABSG41_00170 [Bryobacteraceae bacterium]|jgi:predicted transcriptional regulator